jgi:hypothetical protein
MKETIQRGRNGRRIKPKAQPPESLDKVPEADGYAHPEDRDITTDAVLSPLQFRSEEFARMNVNVIGEYADLRVMGVSAERAFVRVFGTGYQDFYLYARIDALEHNNVYRKLFASKFGLAKLDEMWNLKLSIYELLSLINNPFAKENVRLAALKELNVLYNITMIDQEGNTRPGKGLAEFYAQAAKDTGTRHPEPGTAEAVDYVAGVTGSSTGE